MATRRLAAWLAVAWLAAGPAEAEAPFHLRASVDTPPTHQRTIAIADYLKKLEIASGGRLRGRLHHSGQLYKDVAVPKALRDGTVDFAAPGGSILGGLVADADLVQLPVFYGRPLGQQQRLFDGPIGRKINDMLERKLGARVIGRWLDLGFCNYYSATRPLHDFKDLEGMRIRTSGEAGQFARAKFFGAIPNMTPWPDVPVSLAQGAFDGLATTNESVASAKLWEVGLKYAFEDHQFVGYYIPLVSDSFWKRLPADLQRLLVEVWAQNIASYRSGMEAAQEGAHVTLVEHGVAFVTPSAEQLATVRGRMMLEQDRIARELKLTPDLVKQATDALEK